jgi:hypothetical protein
MVDPPDGSVGDLLFVKVCGGFAIGDFAKEGESAVESAAVVGACDDEVTERAGADGLQPEGVGRERGVEAEFGEEFAEIVDGAEEDGVFVREGGLCAKGTGEHAADAADELGARASGDW